MQFHSLSKVGSGSGKSGGSSGTSSSRLAAGGTGSIFAGSHGSHRRRSRDLDAAVGVITSILRKATVAVLAANIAAHDGGKIPRARRTEIGLAAAFGRGITGSIGFALAGVGAPVGVSATDDGLVDGGTSHTRGNPAAALVGVVPGAVSLALRRVRALLSSRTATADRIVDGRAGRVCTGVLAAVAHTEPSRLQITDGAEGAAVRTACVGIVGLAGATGCALGGAGSGRGAALRRRVAGKLGNAEVVIRTLLGATFKWLEAV